MLSKDEAFFIFNEGKNGMNVNFLNGFCAVRYKAYVGLR